MLPFVQIIHVLKDNHFVKLWSRIQCEANPVGTILGALDLHIIQHPYYKLMLL